MPESMRSRKVADALLSADFFKSLADPVRLQVLRRLHCAEAPLTVTEVQGCCGVHLSGVSRHLSALRAAGVVEAAKVGREVRYQLRREALAARLRALADWAALPPSPSDREAFEAESCCAPPGGEDAAGESGDFAD